MPAFRTRIDRFAEVLQFASMWATTGVVTLAGRYVVARDLPLSPPAAHPPQLLVGGGSDRILELAGRYADLIDLHGDPRHGKVVGATMATAAHGDAQRRALTTVDDFGGSAATCRRGCPGCRPRVGCGERFDPDLGCVSGYRICNGNVGAAVLHTSGIS